jgi:hypothetical protein
MLAWLDEKLFEQEVAEVDAFNLREDGLSQGELQLERLKDALWAARAGCIEPLRDLYPHLAPFLFPPKLGQGRKFPKAVLVREAAADARRITQLWRVHYNKKNRRRGETSAAEFAARRWAVSEDDVTRRVRKPSGKKKPRAK